MYNRYIPQPDGSYQKNRVPDPVPPTRNPPPTPKQQTVPEQPPCSPSEPPCSEQPTKIIPPQRHNDAGDFLRRLLPKDIDTGDLLIIILLLLMAGDCKEEKNTALLTLALYFFL